VAQAVDQLVQPAQRARVRLRLGRIGMHDQVQPALEVVEHRQLFGEHQEGVGRAELVGLVATGQARLDVADRFEAEVADQAAGEGRQAGDARHLVRGAQLFHLGQWIDEFARGHDLAVRARLQHVAAEGVGQPRRQADDRVAPPGLTALHRFEQVGVRAVGELEVDRQRRVEVGQHLAHHRDARVAFGGEAVELLGGNHRAPTLARMSAMTLA
jgi:hypothetical protein